MESTSHFFAKVEMDAERVIESYNPKEHEACIHMKLPNGGLLNRVFEEMGITYAPCPESGTEAFAAASTDSYMNF
jgi:hypothetical protein